jgi:hypothetical protein
LKAFCGLRKLICITDVTPELVDEANRRQHEPWKVSGLFPPNAKG